MLRRWLTVLAAAGLASLAAACVKPAEVQPFEEVGAGDEWTSVGGASDQSGYSRLDQINTENAGRLGLAWSLDLPGEVTLEATPLMVNRTLYFTGSQAKVYAVDARTGALKWEYDPRTWEAKPQVLPLMFGVNRGVAYEDGKIFFASQDCRLFALDAETGEELWVRPSIPRDAVNVCIGAPRMLNGKVIVGNAGAEQGARGFVTAFDSKTGRQLWRFWTVPGNPRRHRGDEALEQASKTWSKDFWKDIGGGGTVSNGITFDPELNRVYIGVGRAWPLDPEQRDPGGGDNLYTASIVALDADTGAYLWHFQENPRGAWGYGSTAEIVLATLEIGGKPRKVLMHTPTNGLFYLLDRETGEFISEGPTTEITWTKSIDSQTGRAVENPEIAFEDGEVEVWPGPLGGHNWQPMAYNPKLGLVFIPIQQLGVRFSRVAADTKVPPAQSEETGAPDQEADSSDAEQAGSQAMEIELIRRKPGDGHGYLVAWDPVAQKRAWQIKQPLLWNGGALTTAGGLVFQGTADGWLNAYNGRTGERRWRFNAGLGIVGAPITYALDGKQYVSVLVGYGTGIPALGRMGNAGWKYGAQPRRLLTFALGARGKLPETSPANFHVEALDDPDLVIDEADVDAGRREFAPCESCHGAKAVATGAPAPDLRESVIAFDLDQFTTLLRDGSLIERGMPMYEDLRDDQVRQLYAYIRARARAALTKREAAEKAEIMPKL